MKCEADHSLRSKKMIDDEIRIGKPFKIEGRSFYPLVKIFHWKGDHAESYSLSPVALVVFEGQMKYLIPLDELGSSQELLDLVSI
jgi:uncharacterized spore protein YtfJ